MVVTEKEIQSLLCDKQRRLCGYLILKQAILPSRYIARLPVFVAAASRLGESYTFLFRRCWQR
jgi:hypothetical protein